MPLCDGDILSLLRVRNLLFKNNSINKIVVGSYIMVCENSENPLLLIKNNRKNMLVLISSAKTMTLSSKISLKQSSVPQFEDQAKEIAIHMAQFTPEELKRIFKVSSKLAVENYHRYRNFFSSEQPSLQALLAYTGVVYRNMGLANFTESDFLYTQKHLRLGSGMYGLLRPFDLIHPYRMEYDVKLPEFGNNNMYPYWKDRLTEQLILDVKEAGGVLVNLAASDVIPSFHWKEVEKEVRVITPYFKLWKEEKLKAIVIYLKMARGKMTRHILKNRIENPEGLKNFVWEGFEFDPELSDENNWMFVG